MGNFDNILLLLISTIGSATVMTTIFRYLRIPTLVGLILSGIAIGPYGLKLVDSLPAAEVVSEVAMILLMFCLGLEFSFTKLKKLSKEFFILGPFQMLLTSSLTAVICMQFYRLPPTISWMWGMLVSFSSTALVLKSLQSSKRDHTTYGNASIGVLLFQDLFVIPVMLFLSFVTPEGGLRLMEGDITVFLRNLLALGILILSLTYIVVPYALGRIARTMSRELLFYSIFLLCFGVAFLAHRIGLSYTIGAFLSGLILADSPYGKHALAEFKLLRDNFLGIFFISIGLLIDPAFFYHKTWAIISITCSILLGKGLIIFCLMTFFRYPRRIALMVSLILFQVGEFSFIIASIAVVKGLLPSDHLQLFLTLAVTTLVLSPIVYNQLPRIVSFIFDRGHEKKKHEIICLDDREEGKTREEVLVVGFGHMGMEVCKFLEKNKVPYRIIEQNFINYSRHRHYWPIRFGDATSFSLIEELDLAHYKLAIICINNPEATEMVVANIKSENPFIKILLRVNYVEEEKKHFNDESIMLFTSEREVTTSVLKELERRYLG